MLYKKQLGREIVALYHGSEAGIAAQEHFEKVFSKKEIPDEMPMHKVSESPINIVKLLAECGACASNSEAKRLIQQAAVTIDNEKLASIESSISISEGMVLKVGKRKFFRLSL